MGKIAERWRNMPLWHSFVCYVLIFACLALLLCFVTYEFCDWAQNKIMAGYDSGPAVRYYLTDEQGEQLGDGVIVYTDPAQLTSEDERLVDLLELAPAVAVPVYTALSILAAAWLFWAQKLREPLTKLQLAAEKIAENDLDFAVECNRQDELGRLCASFELMRARLAANLAEMWRQLESRRRLNRAFAHDLRTPLTVLQGYAEFLQQSEEAEARQTAAVMQRQLHRLTRYVESMSNLQRLEDIVPELSALDWPRLVESLRGLVEEICRNSAKKLQFSAEMSAEMLTGWEWALDKELVANVADNLLNNATRYAAEKVWVELKLKQQAEAVWLCLKVADDGPGFSSEELRLAAEPYYTGADRSEHFGLGLYICTLLCRQHGGGLQFANAEAGGGLVEARFQLALLAKK